MSQVEDNENTTTTAMGDKKKATTKVTVSLSDFRRVSRLILVYLQREQSLGIDVPASQLLAWLVSSDPLHPQRLLSTEGVATSSSENTDEPRDQKQLKQIYRAILRRMMSVDYSLQAAGTNVIIHPNYDLDDLTIINTGREERKRVQEREDFVESSSTLTTDDDISKLFTSMVTADTLPPELEDAQLEAQEEDNKKRQHNRRSLGSTTPSTPLPHSSTSIHHDNTTDAAAKPVTPSRPTTPRGSRK